MCFKFGICSRSLEMYCKGHLYICYVEIREGQHPSRDAKFDDTGFHMYFFQIVSTACNDLGFMRISSKLFTQPAVRYQWMHR